MNDPYNTPESELTNTTGGSAFGSLEKGIAGDFNLSIGDIFSEGWSKVSGNKGTCLGAVGLLIVAMVVVQLGTAFVIGLLPLSAGIAAVLLQIIITMISAPIGVGIALIGIKLVSDSPASATSIFSYFGSMMKLLGLTLLMYLLVAVGFVLLVLPGIYLVVAYMYAPTLLVEKNLGIWEALEASRKAITHCWFKVFFAFLAIGLIVSLAALPLLIGLVWAIPFAMLCGGYIYKTVFGVEQSTLQAD